MKKLKDLRRLKIVEQIIIVLLLAVIVPTAVSAVIINNINQHAVRNELQYSAMSISESIASNIETFAESGEDELNQIVLSLKHIKSDYDKQVYLKDLSSAAYKCSLFKIIHNILGIPVISKDTVGCSLGEV